jgi:soluble lytic murein transglycosylase-like protein
MPHVSEGSAQPFARTLRRSAVAVLMLLGQAACAGNQQYEVLSASVKGALSTAIRDRAAPEARNPEMFGWIASNLPKLRAHIRDEKVARELLVTVHYEASRAGLEPALVMAVIDVESKFRKYAVSSAGAMGYMQVMPFWVREIGDKGHNLFHLRTNLRFGCVILRHYLDIEKGNLSRALGRYNGSLGRPEYPAAVNRAYEARWRGSG